MKPEAVVVGGGFVGLHAAYRLHSLGLRVRVYTGGEIRRAASWGNAGIIHQGSITAVPEVMGLRKLLSLTLRRGSYVSIRPSFVFRELLPGGWLWRYVNEVKRGALAENAALLQQVLTESKRLWIEVIKELNLEADLNENGSIEVFTVQKNFEFESEFRSKESEELGYTVKTLRGDECRSLVPELSREVVGGLLYPDDVHINPSKTITSFIRALRGMGVEVLEDRVTLTHSDGSVTAADSEGRMTPDHLIVCSGAWTRELMRSVGIDLPVVAGRGYLAVTEAIRERFGRPIIYADNRVIIGQTASGEVRLTSVFELASPDAEPDTSKFERIRGWASEALPLVRGLKFVDTWVGPRPCTPDGAPIVGTIRGLRNVVIATGGCRLGATLSSSMGLMVAEVVSGKERALVSRLSPERFRS
ncbi:MAG: FAD-binding oxidoreductase [Thaumarchaeota archaeon]|nr:FAD-binding oxidoreductase [Candidatus Calditenuaceae archaeon]